MLVAERSRLGEAVDRWLQRQRVTKAHVSKHGGVSTNTIWLIQQGTTSSPELETLRKIARGLATDPFSRELDRLVYADALRDLALSCGFPDPTLEESPPPSMEASIRTVARPRGAAESWAEFIRDHSDATPDQIRMLRALWEAMTARGIVPVGERESHSNSSNS